MKSAIIIHETKSVIVYTYEDDNRIYVERADDEDGASVKYKTIQDDFGKIIVVLGDE